MSSSDSYTNNRHDPVGSLWQYDADGNLLIMPGTAYTYDAAGRIHSVESGSTATLSLDGDGRRVKSVEVTFDPQTETESTETTFYVRSTVLGGEVLTEINSNGRTRTFVYADGVVLATQEIWGIAYVIWEHRDPSSATYRTTASDNRPEGDTGRMDRSYRQHGQAVQIYVMSWHGLAMYDPRTNNLCNWLRVLVFLEARVVRIKFLEKGGLIIHASSSHSFADSLATGYCGLDRGLSGWGFT